MNKKLAFLLVWLCHSFLSMQLYAQHDHLHHELDQLIAMTNAKLQNAKVKNRHKSNHIDIEQFRQKLDTSHHQISKASIYNDIAWYYSRSSRFDSVGHYANKAYQLLKFSYAKHRKSEHEYIRSLYFLGVNASMLGLPSNAISYFHEALKVIEKSIYSSFLLKAKYKIVVGIGQLYQIQENYTLELIQYQQFLNKINIDTINSYKNFPNIYFHIGNAYWHLNQLDSAIFYTKKGVEKASVRVVAKNISLLGHFLIRLKRYEEARTYLLHGLNLCKQSGKYWSISDCYHGLAIASTYLNKNEDILTYSKSAYDFAVKSTIPQLIFSRGKQLAAVYNNIGRFDEAYTMLEESVALEKSVINNKEKNEIQRAELELRDAALSIEQKEKYLQHQINDQQRAIILLISGLSIFAVLLSLFIILDRQKKTKLAELLQLRKEELEKLDKSKSDFFTNISHELRTPLTLISSPLKALLATKELDASSKIAQTLKLMQRNTNKLSVLVDDILNLSKLEASKLKLELEEIAIHSLLDRIVANYSPLATHLGISYNTIFTNLPKDVLLLDTIKVEKILNNLLSNAIKHTKSGESIIFIAEKINNQLVISIQDSGQGIAASDLPYIFDRYFQSQQPELALQGGTGIGLALTKELCLLMNGKITVESQLGKGTTFKVFLPYKFVANTSYTHINRPSVAYTEEISLAHLELSQQEHAIPKEHHLLIVEDHPEMQAFIADLLHSRYHIHLATHGKEALKIIEKETIHLIVSDVMMPQMDGFELLEYLKGDHEHKDIPVVMLTALGKEDNKLKALTIGVDDYLCKPFAPQELLARVHNLLERSNVRQEVRTRELEEAPKELKLNPSSFKATEREMSNTLVNNVSWLYEVEQVIRQKMENSEFTLADLAEKFHLSERQFRRKIKQETGLSPKKYKQEIILQKARELLEDGKYGNTTAVAYSVGMNHVTRFARLYEARFGKHPNDYFINAG